jgi:AAA domain/DnaB-like helicase N terminal domain
VTVPVAPQNLEAEESVLGAMLLSPAAIEAVSFLAPDDFYRATHGRIYRAARELHAAGEPVDAITLADALEKRSELADVGGRVRVHELARLVPASANAAHYARMVRESATARRRLAALHAAERAVLDGGLEAHPDVRSELLASLDAEAPADAGWFESAGALLDEDDPGPTPFLVAGLLVLGSIGALAGKWKIGKTWLLLELAVAIVTGRPAFGRFEVPDPGPVLLVVEESGRDALHRRLDALARGYGIEARQLDDLHFAANRRVRLDDRHWQERLIAAGRALEARAIFLDPLVRLKGSGDENVQREMAPVLDYMRDLRDATGSAVVFSHHSGHDSHHLRGSSDLEAYWESKLALRRDENGVLELTSEHREAESGHRLRYLLDGDEATRTMRLRPLDESEAPESEAPSRRDLAHDVAAYLEAHPASPTEEVAAAVCRRREKVAKLLRTDPRFVLVATPAGRNPNAKCWSLAKQPVPAHGTGSDGRRAEQTPGSPFRTPSTPPKGGGRPDRLAASSRPATDPTQNEERA